MPFADLHTHSTASDGVFTPEQMISKAQEAGLSALAITDHDSLEGSRRAIAANTDSRIQIIPGVEIATRFDWRDVHLLAYFVDPSDPDLAQLFQDGRNNRHKRALKMAHLLQQGGFSIDAEKLEREEPAVNRPMLARILVEHGNVESVDECFRTLIGRKSPYYVDIEYPNTAEVIHLVRERGGYAFIAHPAAYRVVDLIPALAQEGMTGLEAYYTLHNPEQTDQLLEMAQDLGLAVSGGSDWHGDATHNAFLGSAGLERKDFELFLRACKH